MEERKEHPALKILEPKIKSESERLLKKNYFIMKLLNDIGCYLDKEFNTLKEFDMEAHFETLIELSNYFQILCEEKIEKRIPLHLIFILIVQIDDLDQHFENLIKYIMQIFLSDNYCKIQKSILDKIMDVELKYCLKKERFSFVLNYSKKFVGDILILFDILCYCFNEEENDYYLLKYVLQDLKEKYSKVIIIDTLLDSIKINKENYFNLLNQLLELNYEQIYSTQVLIYKDSKFQMREPSNEELDSYYKSDFDSKDDKKKKKKKKKKNNNLLAKNTFEQSEQKKEFNIEIDKDSSKISPNNQVTKETISKDIDISQMSQMEKYLYNNLNEVKNELATTNNKLAITNNELATTKNELATTKNELGNKINELGTTINELVTTNNKLNNLEKKYSELKMSVDSLKLELKKIKIRSIYKGVIDIFCHIYNINLNNNYYNKLNELLYVLEKYTENNKIKELKQFLIDIYYYLQKGNVLAHSIEENLTPLEMIFPLIEKDSKKNYLNTKAILQKLSFNKPLSQALNNYYSLKDKKKLIENINFSLKELEQELL